jgi:hypothetical protein
MQNKSIKILAIITVLFASVSVQAQGTMLSDEQVKKLENITTGSNNQPQENQLVNENLQVENGEAVQPNVIQGEIVNQVAVPEQKPEEKKGGILPWLKGKLGSEKKHEPVAQPIQPFQQPVEAPVAVENPIPENTQPQEAKPLPWHNKTPAPAPAPVKVEEKKPEIQNNSKIDNIISNPKALKQKNEVKQEPVNESSYKLFGETGSRVILEFNGDDQTLNKDQILLINALNDKLSNSPEIRVAVESYAGKAELESFARKIALKRALEVRKIIKSADIDKKRIIIKVIDFSNAGSNANKILIREL